MLGVFRLPLIWLLAVALPWQGVSAATMLACGIDFHPVTVARATPHAEGAAIMSAGHGHGAHDAMHVQVVAAASPLEKSPAGPTHEHKCSACASCCLSTFAPPAPVSLDSVELSQSYRPHVPGSLAAFLTQGIERPPRIAFA